LVKGIFSAAEAVTGRRLFERCRLTRRVFLWLFVNSDQEGDGTKMRAKRRHLDTIHALIAIAADIALCPDYVL
jgi:hypothetical protein